MVEVEWAPTSKSVFLVQIQVEALDRRACCGGRGCAEHHVNILSATVSTSSDRLALSRFVFEMGDTTHLDRVLNACAASRPSTTSTGVARADPAPA